MPMHLQAFRANDHTTTIKPPPYFNTLIPKVTKAYLLSVRPYVLFWQVPSPQCLLMNSATAIPSSIRRIDAPRHPFLVQHPLPGLTCYSGKHPLICLPWLRPSSTIGTSRIGMLDKAILGFVHNTQIIRICQLVATVVTIYDHFITFHDEVELIWRHKWTVSKTLFVWIRYMGEIMLIISCGIFLTKGNVFSTEVCYWYFVAQAWGSALIVWSMQVILQFRLYAMYERSKKLLKFLVACFFGEVLVMSIIIGFANTHSTVSPEPMPGVYICTATRVPPFFYAFWFPIIAFETMLSAFAGWQGYLHIMQIRQWNANRLLNVLVQDSIFYFVVTLSAYVTNAVVWETDPQWLEIPEGFALAFTVIMGSRLTLNMRRMYFLSYASELTTCAAGIQSELRIVLPSQPDATVDIPMSIFPPNHTNDAGTSSNADWQFRPSEQDRRTSSKWESSTGQMVSFDESGSSRALLGTQSARTRSVELARADKPEPSQSPLVHNKSISVGVNLSRRDKRTSMPPLSPITP